MSQTQNTCTQTGVPNTNPSPRPRQKARLLLSVILYKQFVHKHIKEETVLEPLWLKLSFFGCRGVIANIYYAIVGLKW